MPHERAARKLKGRRYEGLSTRSKVLAAVWLVHTLNDDEQRPPIGRPVVAGALPLVRVRA